MKFTQAPTPEFDAIDLAILELLQENCKQPLATLGQKVGLSAPSVVERIHKLEEAGVVTGYVALLDARRLGMDVTAFIGVSTDHPRVIDRIERRVAGIGDVLECHHVTGSFTLMVKVKTRNTASLEGLIERLRDVEGVTRTETMVVLSTSAEGPRVPLAGLGESEPRTIRRAGGARARRSAK